ncbi:hypothetical protein SDC9_73103 [bioreactor metagenome]|uniref:Uncharacterized protein n=1 Tax=bioreactor metagenome TaxID=1076179 RepID=A0A644YE78_9ZZZZ
MVIKVGRCRKGICHRCGRARRECYRPVLHGDGRAGGQADNKAAGRAVPLVFYRGRHRHGFARLIDRFVGGQACDRKVGHFKGDCARIGDFCVGYGSPPGVGLVDVLAVGCSAVEDTNRSAIAIGGSLGVVFESCNTVVSDAKGAPRLLLSVLQSAVPFGRFVLYPSQPQLGGRPVIVGGLPRRVGITQASTIIGRGIVGHIPQLCMVDRVVLIPVMRPIQGRRRNRTRKIWGAGLRQRGRKILPGYRIVVAGRISGRETVLPGSGFIVRVFDVRTVCVGNGGRGANSASQRTVLPGQRARILAIIITPRCGKAAGGAGTEKLHGYAYRFGCRKLRRVCDGRAKWQDADDGQQAKQRRKATLHDPHGLFPPSCAGKGQAIYKR